MPAPWKPATNVTMRHVHGKAYPAVNIKVHRFVSMTQYADKLPKDELSDADFPQWLRNWDTKATDEDREGIYEQACSQGVDDMIQDAENVFRFDACALGLPGYDVDVYQDGRMGGWLYVKGLPEDVEAWDETMRKAWTAWTEGCRGTCDNLEYAMAWIIYANDFEDWAVDRDRRNAEAEMAEALIARTST